MSTKQSRKTKRRKDRQHVAASAKAAKRQQGLRNLRAASLLGMPLASAAVFAALSQSRRLRSIDQYGPEE